MPIIHWAPRKAGLLACDISVNNVLAIANSKLVGEYTKIDRRLITLGVCVKAWANARGINDRSRGTLSSFSLVLMLIHYLQNNGILPSLQDLAVARNYAPVYVNGVDCRFCGDGAEIAEELEFLRGKMGAELERRHGRGVGSMPVQYTRCREMMIFDVCLSLCRGSSHWVVV